MGEPCSILIVSDIHYASDLEKRRTDFESLAIDNPVIRSLVGLYRKYIWLRDPFGHNHLIERVLNPPLEPDLVISNGDYSCDSAFIGVSDPASLQSAAECLSRLRNRFGSRLLSTFGDHELGKTSLAGGKGGLRLESYKAAREKLGLEPFWTHSVGHYLLVGVTSTLIALPIYEKEALAEELEGWRAARAGHMARINEVFEKLRPDQRVILFCHDPTALPYLYQERPVRGRVNQIERTVIGHLHTRLLVWQSRLLAGIPPIRGCGAAIGRMSTALHQAKTWKHFNVLLCPSLAGIELFKRGGFYTLQLDPAAIQSPEFRLHPVERSQS